MDTELVVPVIEFFDVDGIVQVFRIFAVNREDRLVTKVDATDEVFLIRLVRHRVRLRDHVLRELRRNAVFIDDRQDVDAWVVLMPDDADDVTGTGEASVRILRDAHDDFMSVDGTERFFRVDDRPEVDALVIRLDEGELVESTARERIRPDELGESSLQYFQ